MELHELSDEQLANMSDDEYKQKSRKMDRNLKKATDERRASAMKLLKQDAPQTKLVNDEEGKPVEVQTNTDTKDPNKVPDTLGGKIPNESGKPEGEITEQTSNAEKVINDVERGEKPSEIGKAQIKSVWGSELGNGKKGEETNKTETTETTEKERPPFDPPLPPEPPKTEKDLKQTLNEYKAYLRKGIIRDYKNGLFGDINTPEGRKDARSLATYYIVNRVGTFLANLSNGYFGRQMVNSAYKDLLQEQEKALTELGVERYGEQVKREISKDWNVSDEEREDIIKGITLKQMFKELDINNQTVTSRWLRDKNLLSFGAKVNEMDNAELKKAILSNEQLMSIIENLDEATRKLAVDKNRVEQEIISQIIKNKHLDTKELLENINLGVDVGGKTLGAVFKAATSLIK